MGKTLVKLGLVFFLSAFVATVLAGYAVWKRYAPGLPVLCSLEGYNPKIGTVLYASDGQKIAEFAAEKRVLVSPGEIPALLVQAFVSAEDKRFYVHRGLDGWGVLQAVWGKIRRPEEKLRGASTITQQVAKSLLATGEGYASATERSLQRKIREALLAWQLEGCLSKQDILYVYLNQIFLGHRAYGVGAASQHYFHKTPAQLTLAEMATLAGLVQRPSDYSPVVRPEAAKARRGYVLGRMLKDGAITQQAYEVAMKEVLKVYPYEEIFLDTVPYYAEQVRKELVQRYGERTVLEEGLQVHTAVRMDQQRMADVAVDEGLRALDKRQGYRGPLMRLAHAVEARNFVEAYKGVLGLSKDRIFTPQKNVLYAAVVRSISGDGLWAVLDVAGTEGVLPRAAMRWARVPEPMQRVDMHYVTDIHSVLSVNDVVAVRLTSREELLQDVHAQGDKASLVAPGVWYALEQDPQAQAALLSVDAETGDVVAEVGGFDFAQSHFDRSIQSCREPGSAFKPVVYAAAVDKLDYTASTLLDDKPLIFDDPDNATRWKPNNAGGDFKGTLPLRTCVKDSINTPALRVAEAVGIGDVIKTAQRLGIESALKHELGTALGSSCVTLKELVQVYAVLNQYGVRKPLRFIRKVLDRDGNVLEDHTHSSDAGVSMFSQMSRAYHEANTPPHEVLDPPTAFIMTSLLRNVVTGGTATGALALGVPVVGKTGTTNDSYDAWFVGYTPRTVTGVWVGHDTKERPLGVNESGGHTALPLFVSYMKQVLLYAKEGDFEVPEGVVSVNIDPETGLLARPGEKAVTEYYRVGTEPVVVAQDKNVFDASSQNPYEVDTP